MTAGRATAPATKKRKGGGKKRAPEAWGSSSGGSWKSESIYDSYGKEDRGTYPCAVYMARAVARKLKELESITRLTVEDTKARRRAANRERASWLLIAWSRYLASYPTGERVRLPQSKEERERGDEPRYETLEPSIEYASMFQEERELLRYALSRAVLGADGIYRLPEEVQKP